MSPVTAIHVLDEDVLPFFEQHQPTISTIISDNDHEFCGRHDRNSLGLFLQLESIEHRKIKIRRPQSNAFVERMHRTLLDVHFRIKGLQNGYEFRRVF